MREMSLQGIWEVNMGSEEMPEQFPLRMMLPGTTGAFGLGPKSTEPEAACLTQTHPFEGRVWYRKIIRWDGGHMFLEMERTRKTHVFLDGRDMGSETSLCTPHVYDLGSPAPGQHALAVCVENRDYLTGGHMVSRDTQTNWNGILGSIRLT